MKKCVPFSETASIKLELSLPSHVPNATCPQARYRAARNVVPSSGRRGRMGKLPKFDCSVTSSLETLNTLLRQYSFENRSNRHIKYLRSTRRLKPVGVKKRGTSKTQSRSSPPREELYLYQHIPYSGTYRMI